MTAEITTVSKSLNSENNSKLVFPNPEEEQWPNIKITVKKDKQRTCDRDTCPNQLTTRYTRIGDTDLFIPDEIAGDGRTKYEVINCNRECINHIMDIKIGGINYVLFRAEQDYLEQRDQGENFARYAILSIE